MQRETCRSQRQTALRDALRPPSCVGKHYRGRATNYLIRASQIGRPGSPPHSGSSLRLSGLDGAASGRPISSCSELGQITVPPAECELPWRSLRNIPCGGGNGSSAAHSQSGARLPPFLFYSCAFPRGTALPPSTS